MEKKIKITKEALAKGAKSSCRACYGRGYSGYKGDSLVVCHCVIKRNRIALKNDKPAEGDSRAEAEKRAAEPFDV